MDFEVLKRLGLAYMNIDCENHMNHIKKPTIIIS